MKRFLFMLFCFLVSGCMTMSSPEKITLITVANVKKGMIKREVVKFLGEDVIIGYMFNKKTRGIRYIKIHNPYRTERLKKKSIFYDILFFFTQIKKQDGIIADDELMPFVFLNEKLVGYGWPFLNKLLRE